MTKAREAQSLKGASAESLPGAGGRQAPHRAQLLRPWSQPWFLCFFLPSFLDSGATAKRWLVSSLASFQAGWQGDFTDGLSEATSLAWPEISQVASTTPNCHLFIAADYCNDKGRWLGQAKGDWKEMGEVKKVKKRLF